MGEAVEREGFRDAMALPAVRDNVTELVGEDVFSERTPAKKFLTECRFRGIFPLTV